MAFPGSPPLVMLIRHGEKPPDGGGSPNGVDDDGNVSEFSLTPKGWSRAGALVKFFRAPTVAGVETPTVIYAATAVQKKGSPHGCRPSQTVTPLAQAAGHAIRLDTTFAVTQEAALANAILQEAGVVLVCWEHHALTALVQGLLSDPTFTTAYDGTRFDLVWLLRPGDNGITVATQALLFGDAGVQ